MKKLIAVILALVMMGSLAPAEDTAAAQDMMGRKFQFFLERTLQNIVSLQGRDAVLAFKDGDDEVLNARLQQKDGTVSLRIRVQNWETVMIQANGEAAWALVNGQAAGIRFEELASLFQSAPVPLADSRIYEVLFRLLAQETILKGIRTEQEGDATHITVDLTVKEMLKGVVQWMDDVLQIPQCRDAIVPLFDQILAAVGSGAGLEAQWPSIREELLAVETDARIAGEITYSNREAQFDGKLTLTSGDAEYSLAFDAANQHGESNFQVILSGNGGYGPAADMMALRVKTDSRAESFRAELEMIQEGATMVLTGVHRRDRGTLQLDLSGYPQEKVPFTAHLFARNGGSLREGYELRLDAANQQTRQDVSLDLEVRDVYQSFRLRTNQGYMGSQEFSAVAQEDLRGRLTYAALTAPGFSAVYEPGKLTIQDNSNKATVTGGYENELTNVLNVVTESRYGDEPTRQQVRTEIATSEPGSESVSCSVLDENGDALASLRLFCDEQEELPLISEMNPMMITKDMLRQMTR